MPSRSGSASPGLPSAPLLMLFARLVLRSSFFHVERESDTTTPHRARR